MLRNDREEAVLLLLHLNLSEYVPEISGAYHVEPEREANTGEGRVKDEKKLSFDYKSLNLLA